MGDDTADDDAEEVDLIYYQNTLPYKEVKRVTLSKEHYDCAMVVNDLRVEEIALDYSFVVLFTTEANNTPCKIVDYPSEKTILLPDGKQD